MESISTRMERWLRDEIVNFGEAQRAGPSEALRRVAEEWWALQHFPSLEFRDGVTGRRAGIRQGPDVWEIVMVWKDYDPDRAAFASHFDGHVLPECLDEALEYYKRLPEEIDARLHESRRLAAHLEGRAR